MKKFLVGTLCSAVLAAAAVPALADHQIGGYFRTNFMTDNLSTSTDRTKWPAFNADDDNRQPNTYVETRVRARWQNNINEYVTVVWFGEMDAFWGGLTKGGTVGGGKQGADGVNVETKNAFLDVKIPNTPISTRIGIQPFGDETLRGVILNDDAAGITASAKMEKVTITGGWVKLDEGSSTTAEDDSDAYGIRVGITPMPGLVLSPEVYYFENKGTYKLFNDAVTLDNTSMVFVGLGASYKFNNFDLGGGFIFQGGESDATIAAQQDTVDIAAWTATVKAAADFSGFKVGVRALFFPEQDDDEDLTTFTPPNGDNGKFEFYDEGLSIFLADMYYMNGPSGRMALTDAAYAGYGLMGLVANCAYTLPSLKAMTIKGAVGFFSAMDDKPENPDVSSTVIPEREGTNLGTELALSVGYKVGEKAEFILRGAYAMLGDFYDETAGGDDPDDTYKLALTVNVPY